MPSKIKCILNTELTCYFYIPYPCQLFQNVDGVHRYIKLSVNLVNVQLLQTCLYRFAFLACKRINKETRFF